MNKIIFLNVEPNGKGGSRYVEPDWQQIITILECLKRAEKELLEKE